MVDKILEDFWIRRCLKCTAHCAPNGTDTCGDEDIKICMAQEKSH